ncbi:MAG: DUF423 domain-containing protein [Parvularculaceae bacterium]
MDRRLAFAAAVAGFLAVALGAFGAHALGGKLSAEAQGWWETATQYGLAHAVAAFAAALPAGARFHRAGWAFIIGAALFAGSLYAMALLSTSGGIPRTLGMATPLGGVCLLAGWALAAVAALRDKD